MTPPRPLAIGIDWRARVDAFRTRFEQDVAGETPSDLDVCSLAEAYAPDRLGQMVSNRAPLTEEQMRMADERWQEYDGCTPYRN
jgi:hypothetical protein